MNVLSERRLERIPPAPEPRPAKAAEASKAPAISRAAAILRLLGKSDAPLGVNAIARELGLVPSTCLHVLRALVAEEFVALDPDTKRYSLEAGVLTLARRWLKGNRFSDLARAPLDHISQAFGVTSFGVHIVGLDHMIVVAVSQSGANLQLSTEIGSRFPALVSATGRCIAAFGGYPEAEIEARFRALRWDRPPTFEEWTAQVRDTREQGFAVDRSRYIDGVTVIAAPVWKARGKLSHAMVAVGIGSTLKGAVLSDLQQAVLSAAQTLSAQLGGEAGA
jgi:DNA-binding IclR family transcriptional regulator